MLVGAHQAKGFSLLGIHRKSRHGEISTGLTVVLNKQAVIHPVELVTGKNQILINIPFLEQPLVFAHRISGAFKPGGTLRCLLSSQHLHKALTKTCTEVVGLREVTIQRSTVELRQHIHLGDAGVDAVTDRNIDQTVFTCEGHSRLGPHFGEWVQARTRTSTKNDCQNALHACPYTLETGANLTDFLLEKPGSPQDQTRPSRLSARPCKSLAREAISGRRYVALEIKDPFNHP